MMRVLQVDSKEDLMEELPDEAKMIVVVYHDKEPMREEQDQVEETEGEASPERNEEPDEALEYMPSM